MLARDLGDIESKGTRELGDRSTMAPLTALICFAESSNRNRPIPTPRIDKNS